MLPLPDIVVKKLFGTEVIVVGVFESEYYPVHALWVKQNQDDISETKYRLYNNLEQFAEDPEAQSKRLPIVLLIDNEHVILENQTDASSVFEEEDFLTLTFENGSSLSAVVRKDVAAEYLETFKELAQQVVDIYVGPLRCLEWAESLSIDQPYRIGIHEISVQENEVEIKKAPTPADVVVDGKRRSTIQLALLLASFSFFLDSMSADWEQVNRTAREFFFERLLNRVLPLGAAVLFMIFLTSASLFFYYGGENEKLKESSYEQELLEERAKKYSEDINRLEKILGPDEHQSVFSRIATDLAKSVPASLNLIALDVFPSDMAEMKRKKNLISSSEVHIKGLTTRMNKVPIWLNKLKKMPWVQDIRKHEVKKSDKGYQIDIVLAVGDVE